MKTSARFLAILLAVVMIAGAALSVSAFDDVAGNKHANAINVLAQLGVIGGYEDGTFKPDQKVTRAEMAKLVYVLYTTFVDAGTGVTAFTDVAADNWAAGYINWCSQKGIIGGYGDGRFGPNDNVTYDQALKMVCGVLGYTDWNSSIWPVDVRTKALRELNLGEELDGINGNDQLTRAQVAQIMYNALDEKMNEKKTVNQVLPGTSYIAPIEVNKTLQTDIWKVEEIKVTVVAVDTDKNTITIDKAINGDITFKLDEIGLDAYEGKVTVLKGLQLIGLKKSDKDELLGGLTVLGSVVDGVKVEYNKALDTITIDGVAYKATTEEDEVNLKVNGVDAFKTEANAKKAYEITDAVKTTLDNAYMARAIDVDGDAVIDELLIAPKTAVKVVSIGKTSDKLVTLKTLVGDIYTTTKAANISTEVEKNDILIVATLGDIVYAEKITPVNTYATKLNDAAGKVTLVNIGEVKYTNLTIAGVAPQAITSAVLGVDNTTGYYVYNGEVILAEDIKVASDYSFAILKDIVKKDENTLNETTMKYETSYEATLIVKGEEIKVAIPAEGTAIIVNTVDEVKTDDLTAEEALTVYGAEIVDKVPNYKYTLITAYDKNDNGEYILTIITDDTAKFNENDAIVEGTFAYNTNTGLYVIGGNSKVILDVDSVIYYTYTKETTGDFVYVGHYTEDTITNKKFDTKTLNGKAYLTYDAANKIYTLLAAFVDGEIKGRADGVTTYKEDGTLVLYAPESSSIVAGNDGKTYYEYTFMNKVPTVNIDKTVDDGATAVLAGNFYAWDADSEKYVLVTDTDTFKYVTIENIFETKKYILEYNDGSTKMDVITEDLVIWGLYVNKNGEKVLNEYKILTVTELMAMLDAVAVYNEDEENPTDYIVHAILVRTEDANTVDKFNIESIIVEIYEENEDGELVPVNSSLFQTR